MHVETVRKVGAGFAVAAFGICFWNIVTYGSDIGGSFTFMYIATILAIISQIFMIAVYAFQNAVIFPHKLFNVLGFFSLSYLARDISLKLKIMNLIK